MSIPFKKLKFLSDLFSEGGKYTQDELSDLFYEKFGRRLNRSFYDYINLLESDEYQAPLERQHDKSPFGKTIYYYGSKFWLNKNPLDEKDVQKLKKVLNVLKQLDGLPQIGDLTEIIATIESKSPLKAKEMQPTILLDHSPPIVGTHWIGILTKHIENKTPIQVRYRPFSGDELDNKRNHTFFHLHPYVVKRAQQYWYLVGWHHEANQMGTYAIDRIKDVQTASGILFRRNDEDFKTYYDEVIGATKLLEKPVQTYRVKVYKPMVGYWAHRPLHHSQKCIEEAEDYSIFELQLRWNYEWQNLILNCGENVAVLEPLEFRQQIQQILQKSLNRYL
jgi:predicted DNA-binding transcriptional regulator YafY